VPAPPWQSPRSLKACSWCASANILRGWRALQPVHFPAVFEDDDGTRTSGNPRLMDDVAGQIEITALAHLEAFARVAFLEKVRPSEEKMRLAFFVSVFGNVQRGGKVNHQRRGIGLRVNAKECEKR